MEEMVVSRGMKQRNKMNGGDGGVEEDEAEEEDEWRTYWC